MTARPRIGSYRQGSCAASERAAVDTTPVAEGTIDDQFVERWRLKLDSPGSQVYAPLVDTPDTENGADSPSLEYEDWIPFESVEEVFSPPWAVGAVSFSSLHARTPSSPCKSNGFPLHNHGEHILAEGSPKIQSKPEVVLTTDACEIMSAFLDEVGSPMSADSILQCSTKPSGGCTVLSMARARAGGA